MLTLFVLLALVFMLVLVVGVVLSFQRFAQTTDYRLLTSLRKTPAVPIAKLKHGSVAKVIGTVQPAQPSLHAPISNRTCVCYRVRIEEEIVVTNADMSTSTMWNTVVDDANGVDFYLSDASGRALVQAQSADSLFDWDERYGDGSYETAETTPAYGDFCRRHGLDPIHQKLRCFEGVLEAGEVGYVLATVERAPGLEPVVLGKRGEAPLYIADADKFEVFRDAAPGPKGHSY